MSSFRLRGRRLLISGVSNQCVTSDGPGGNVTVPRVPLTIEHPADFGLSD
jgi:hypothetical protein